MIWSAHVVETMSGRRGPAIPLAGRSTATVTLNTFDEIDVTTTWGSVAGLGLRPWVHSLLVCVDYGDGEQPVAGGPLVNPPAPSSLVANLGEEVTLSAQGMRSILQHRIITGADHGPGDEAALVAARPGWSGISLGSIGWRLIEQAMAKRAGWLPIVHGQADDPASRVRNYEGYNLANNDVDKLLDDLSNVINGPDIMLRPRWATEDADRVEWAYVHGTQLDPHIPQTHSWGLDATAPDGPVSSVELTVGDLPNPATRAYGVGAGEGAGVLVRTAESIPQGWPLLEQVAGESDSETPAVVLGKAEAMLGVDPLVQLTITWDARQEGVRADQVHVGDRAILNLPSVPHLVPAGRSRWQLIALKADLGSPHVVGEFQPGGAQ